MSSPAWGSMWKKGKQWCNALVAKKSRGYRSKESTPIPKEDESKKEEKNS